jgi:UDP-N-acetyl-alpha-D-muramoyl-L-alanyl-L-glutamate epimerase
MRQFIFEKYDFNAEQGMASFHYRYDDGRQFIETVNFQPATDYDETVLDKALFLAFVVIGTSYLKTFPTPNVLLETGDIDEWQAHFFTKVYQEGLSQYAFENQLTRDDLPHFSAAATSGHSPVPYAGKGVLALQSGGKDSLLTAALLTKKGVPFDTWYLSSSGTHPALLDELGSPLITATRTIDHDALKAAAIDGAKNGHVPVTYIVQSVALIQAILLGKNEVLVSIAHEGEEPHASIEGLTVTHQWSKTWAAEQAFAEYVHRYISPDLQIGSPLRSYSELRVAELFVEHAWGRFGHSFSSCNRANYQQGADSSTLRWCGDCPKCANSYLLFAPFVAATELQSLFGDNNLFTVSSLGETFKGLLGVEGVMKPFECVGEVDELRTAYHWAMQKGGYQPLPFAVPLAQFEYLTVYPSQQWPLLQ